MSVVCRFERPRSQLTYRDAIKSQPTQTLKSRQQRRRLIQLMRLADLTNRSAHTQMRKSNRRQPTVIPPSNPRQNATTTPPPKADNVKSTITVSSIAAYTCGCTSYPPIFHPSTAVPSLAQIIAAAAPVTAEPISSPPDKNHPPQTVYLRRRTVPTAPTPIVGNRAQYPVSHGSRMRRAPRV